MSDRPKIGELWRIENWCGFEVLNRTIHQFVLIVGIKDPKQIHVAADLEMFECLLDNGNIKNLALWHFNTGKRIG